MEEGRLEVNGASQRPGSAIEQLSAIYEALSPYDASDSRRAVQILLERSSCYHHQMQYDAAFQDCRTILQLDDKCEHAYAQIIETLSAMSHLEEAIKYALLWSRIKLQAVTGESQQLTLNDGVALPCPTAKADAGEQGSKCLPTSVEQESKDPSCRGADTDSSKKLAGSDGQFSHSMLAVARNYASHATDVTRSTDAKESPTNPVSDWRCSLCSIELTSSRILRAHLHSADHMARVASDAERSWTYRAPPHGYIEEEYSLCEKNRTGWAPCRFGEACVQAHSMAELDEWRQRFAFRQQKAAQAESEAAALLRSAGPPSLAERVSELLTTVKDQSCVLAQSVNGISITSSSDLLVSTTCKKFEHIWEFTISSLVALQAVSLLGDEEGMSSSPYYVTSVSSPEHKVYLTKMTSDERCREWSSSKWKAAFTGSSSSSMIYTVKVGFKTSVFGTYDQCVVFSFGHTSDMIPPFLSRRLRVEAKAIDLEQVAENLEVTEGCRWDTEGSGVILVPFQPRLGLLSKHEEELIAKYTCPSPKTFQVCNSLATEGLCKKIYKSSLHELLYAEEMARYATVAKYNVTAMLHICKVIGSDEPDSFGYKYSTNGQLFARADLKAFINEDSREGRLMMQSVTSVYLLPQTSYGELPGHLQAYEALIEDKGAKRISLRLSQLMVSECRLVHGMIATFQIQFMPSRLSLCELHWAVDAVRNLDTLFLEADRVPTVPWNPISFQLVGLLQKDRPLNLKQTEAIACISTPRHVALPPILLLGPFGTGKTFTLAQAAIRLVTCEPGSRVLLCTHSNSAADLYVSDYLDPNLHELADEAGKRPNELLVRLYYRSRRVNTVDRTVLKYCLLVQSHDGTKEFRDPMLADLQSARFVVTTLASSCCLHTIGLAEDFFTHIFIDEAAQAIEPEALIPLSLATSWTRIVLAGDHMQMNPEIFSDLARSHCLHISLIERMNDLYPATSATKIMLCENYRSHPAIVKFASTTFYDGNLLASGNQPAHPWLHPLCFFTARGDDTPHVEGSASYYNNAEVFEMVDRVAELWRSWPVDRWGELSDKSIGVVAPYADQVTRIRSELRRRGLPRVSVERVFNVQGKQFRVVLISTVRTSRMCTASDIGDAGINYGFLTDAKLLNTALTRAQSLVAVVGDPLSLCTVGRCRKIWESYIETCHRNGSLYGITWNEVRAHLDGLNIKKSSTLNPLAPTFVPRYVFYTVPCANCGFQNSLLTSTALPTLLAHPPVVPPLVHLHTSPRQPLLLPVAGSGPPAMPTPLLLPTGQWPPLVGGSAASKITSKQGEGAAVANPTHEQHASQRTTLGRSPLHHVLASAASGAARQAAESMPADFPAAHLRQMSVPAGVGLWLPSSSSRISTSKPISPLPGISGTGFWTAQPAPLIPSSAAFQMPPAAAHPSQLGLLPLPLPSPFAAAPPFAGHELPLYRAPPAWPVVAPADSFAYRLPLPWPKPATDSGSGMARVGQCAALPLRADPVPALLPFGTTGYGLLPLPGGPLPMRGPPQASSLHPNEEASVHHRRHLQPRLAGNFFERQEPAFFQSHSVGAARGMSGIGSAQQRLLLPASPACLRQPAGHQGSRLAAQQTAAMAAQAGDCAHDSGLQGWPLLAASPAGGPAARAANSDNLQQQQHQGTGSYAEALRKPPGP